MLGKFEREGSRGRQRFVKPVTADAEDHVVGRRGVGPHVAEPTAAQRSEGQG